jgi:hypothetical protein
MIQEVKKRDRRGAAARRARLGERGQSMVEIAFLLPIFFGMVFAIIEVGRAWSVKQALTIAAREGARVLILPYGAGLTYNSESDVQTAAINTVTSYLNSAGVPTGDLTQINLARIGPGNDGEYGTNDDPDPEVGYTNGIRGERVGVQIRHRFDTPLPLILVMFNNTNATGEPREARIGMGVSCYMEHE